MEPKILEMHEMIIVGSVASGNSIGDIDIHKLWQQFESNESNVKHKIEGKGYEVHICGDYSGIKNHYCITGVEVNKMYVLIFNLTFR